MGLFFIFIVLLGIWATMSNIRGELTRMNNLKEVENLKDRR